MFKHKEDLNFHSLNYHHTGATKTWFAIDPKHSKKVLDILDERFEGKRCGYHKRVFLSPNFLLQNGISFIKVKYFIILELKI
jgi:hypothetical protein